MEWNTRNPGADNDETTASRRSDVIEFGAEEQDTEVLAFEVCKGLVLALD